MLRFLPSFYYSKGKIKQPFENSFHFHTSMSFLSFFKRICLFIWQKERTSRGRGRRGGRSRLPAEPRRGARSWDPEIVTWAKGRTFTDWATQVPFKLFSMWKTNSLLQVKAKVLDILIPSFTDIQKGPTHVQFISFLSRWGFSKVSPR